MKNEEQFNAPAREPINHSSAILNNLDNKIPKQERSYSEEEVLESFIEGDKQRAERSDLIFDNLMRIAATRRFNKWFEQFKNK